MLLSLLLTDRISGLKRQTRSTLVITSTFTSAKPQPLLIPVQQDCRHLRGGYEGSSWNQQRTPWVKGRGEKMLHGNQNRISQFN
ncbi:hypothetical protein CapIbe_008739 [Capra ibex]